MLWHGGVIYLASSTCYLLHISNLVTLSGSVRPTLWVGSNNTVQWCYLPTSENPLQDSYYAYSTTYSLYIPGQDWRRTATPKNLLQIDVEADNLSPAVTLAINISIDGGAYSSFGTAKVSPQSAVIPSSEMIGRRMAFRYDGTGATTGGPNIRGILKRAAARVKTRAIRTYQIKLAEGQGDNYRGVDNRNPADVWYSLQALETGQQVQVRDEWGETLTCLVHAPVTREEIEETVRGNETRTVMVATLTLSVLRRLTSPWRWGDGTLWGSGKQWGAA